MENLALWSNLKDGDKTALKTLHKKHYHQLYFYAVKSVDGNIGLAEELVSDCFIKLWENRRKIEIRDSVKSYLFFILRNSIIDYYRKNRIATEPLTIDFKAPENERFFDEQERYVQLYEVLKRLPEQRRRILELAIFDSLTYKAIAEKLEISKNTVKTQISRAYRFLKENLDYNDF